MAEPVTIYYLEMLDSADLIPKECHDKNLEVKECLLKDYRYNRFLYEYVGKDWHWVDKLPWSEEEWRLYAESENLRTWVAYLEGTPVGYYELERTSESDVQIAYFGLATRFVGNGYGGCLLTHAVRSAWDWEAKRVWVHTCTLDHPHALANYLARGFKIYREETTQR